jgi:hypothetical protein
MKHTKIIPKNLSGKVEIRMEICLDLVARLLLESSFLGNWYMVMRLGSPV